MRRRVLLIALDGAEPSILSPLVDARAMPHLHGIVERGASGGLAATTPLVRAMLWTTVATGVRAPAHGVCGDIQVRDDGGGVQPSGHLAWRAPALWELLRHAGLRCAAVGWPATAPAASWDSGFVVDDAFAEALGPGFDAWPLLPDCVTPVDARDTLRQLRVHPGDISGTQLLGLLPHAQRIDQESDPRLAQVAVALARASTVHAVATHVAAGADWDFCAVAYPLLADIQQGFMRYRAPACADVSAADVEIFGGLVDTAYRLQDAMLGTLLQCAGADVTVFVVSAYGYAAGSDRPDARTTTALARAVAWHRRKGYLAAAGAGIARDALVHDATLLDVAPTVLNLFGLRVEGLDGRCLEGLCPVDPAARTVAAPARDDGGALRPGVDDLAALEPAQRAPVQRATIAWIGNTAEAYFAAGRYADAAAQFTHLLGYSPDDWLAKARLARCRLHLGEHDACRALAAEVIQARPNDPWGYLLCGAAMVLAGQGAQADDHLQRARDTGRGLPNLSLRLGTLHLVRQEYGEAEALFRDALRAMPQSVEAHDGLGCALYAQQRYREAVVAFRAGLGHRFHYPLAHLHLGMTLAALELWDAAADATRTALSQDARIPGGAALLERIERARAAEAART